MSLKIRDCLEKGKSRPSSSSSRGRSVGSQECLHLPGLMRGGKLSLGGAGKVWANSPPHLNKSDNCGAAHKPGLCDCITLRPLSLDSGLCVEPCEDGPGASFFSHLI